ncbi:hypothetical protein [Kamptonema formosum]|uniref:hypothetical protein n=1 Tax=Kamptonema formosum TaxID=331992 RepID=UPI001E609EAA|nr:hypothetical protein [Oscillatoria sp. PCC 10802]
MKPATFKFMDGKFSLPVSRRWFAAKLERLPAAGFLRDNFWENPSECAPALPLLPFQTGCARKSPAVWPPATSPAPALRFGAGATVPHA